MSCGDSSRPRFESWLSHGVQTSGFTSSRPCLILKTGFPIRDRYQEEKACDKPCLAQGRRNYKCELPFGPQAWRAASPISTAAPPSRSCPGHWGCQLWSAGSVLTLHPVPEILQEALGRAAGSELKRGGWTRIEGGWVGQREGWHPRHRGPLPGLHLQCPQVADARPLPSLRPASSLPSRLWAVAPVHPKAKSGPGLVGSWARGLCVPRAAAPPSRPPRPLRGRLAGGGACAPSWGRRGTRVR